MLCTQKNITPLSSGRNDDDDDNNVVDHRLCASRDVHHAAIWSISLNAQRLNGAQLLWWLCKLER